MTPFGIVVWQQPMPEQDPSTPSLIVSHRDMNPVVYAVPLKPFIKACVTTNGGELVFGVGDGELGQSNPRIIIICTLTRAIIAILGKVRIDAQFTRKPYVRHNYIALTQKR